MKLDILDNTMLIGDTILFYTIYINVNFCIKFKMYKNVPIRGK